MIKKIRQRFIAYTMLVISTSIVIIAVSIIYGGNSSISWQRWLLTGIVALIVVFLSSWLISTAAIRPIKKAWQRQLDFTADASHELRTPLAVIQTSLELVLDNPKSTVQDQTQWLTNALEETLSMNKLVQDLLMLARADTEETAFQKEELNFSETVTAVVNGFVPMADKRHIQVHNVITDDIHMIGDVERLRQLVVIVLDNALRYTDDLGKVTIALSSEGKQVILQVTDTGEGIAEDEIPHLFERFYRVDKVRSREAGGTGLGLSIAQWIVNRHNGQIHIDSVVGEGTTVIVTLPAG